MAITAWSAKVVHQRQLLVAEGRIFNAATRQVATDAAFVPQHRDPVGQRLVSGYVRHESCTENV